MNGRVKLSFINNPKILFISLCHVLSLAESESEVSFCRTAPENPYKAEKLDIVIIATTLRESIGNRNFWMKKNRIPGK